MSVCERSIIEIIINFSLSLFFSCSFFLYHLYLSFHITSLQFCYEGVALLICFTHVSQPITARFCSCQHPFAFCQQRICYTQLFLIKMCKIFFINSSRTPWPTEIDGIFEFLRQFASGRMLIIFQTNVDKGNKRISILIQLKQLTVHVSVTPVALIITIMRLMLAIFWRRFQRCQLIC